ncbi:MAG: hypothetical protein ACKN9V_05620 [Pseudomonadota bacterium]
MKRAVFFLGFGVLLSQAFAVTFHDPVSKISFAYDENLWEVVPTKTNEKETLVNLQRKVADKDGETAYFSRISIVKEDTNQVKKVKTSQFPKLQAYRSHAIEFLRSQRFDILSSDMKKVEGLPAGAFEILANQRDFGLTYQQVGFLDGDTAYLVTATVRTKKFSEYKAELEKLFQSIRLAS